MEDLDLAVTLREAFGSDTEPSERVWRRMQKPEPRWLPSLSETVLASMVGLAVLAWLAKPQPVDTKRPLVRQESPIEKAFVVSTQMPTTFR